MKEVYGLGTSYTYYQLQDHGYVMPSRIVPRTGDDPPTTKQLKLTISNITEFLKASLGQPIVLRYEKGITKTINILDYMK